ncbi:hypothetical protein CPB84DRAFT_1832596 [Gymnopilus junonius]|uniref:Uncharacterized protein n=1 Tax=Gymnopilus junonius TaxID=109634 RepID=A0A9P5TE92_GYMJU|nr:hypothetical protein CPB84DRAFT_1832596 [Gymnopilus junonius]
MSFAPRVFGKPVRLAGLPFGYDAVSVPYESMGHRENIPCKYERVRGEPQLTPLESHHTRLVFLQPLYVNARQVHTFAERYRTLKMSLIKRFPDNVLERIFFIALTNPVFIPPCNNDPHAKLMTVSEQCSKIILSLPGLWDSYLFRHRPFRNSDAVVAIFRMYLHLSGSKPLTFLFSTDFHWKLEDTFVDLKLPPEHLGDRKISIVNEIIQPNAMRLQHLSIVLTVSEAAKLLLDIPEDAFRALKTISVTLIVETTPGISTFTFEDQYPFTALPPLREGLRHIKGGIDALVTKLPWGSVTKLNLGNVRIPLAVFMRIMLLSKASLTEAYFYIHFTTRSSTDLRPRYQKPITMTSLTKLRLRLVDADFFPEFILPLRLPVVEELQIEQGTKRCSLSWNLGIYTTWFFRCKRSATSLRRLKLSEFALPGQSDATIHGSSSLGSKSYRVLEKFLKKLPGLQSLFLPAGIRIHLPILDALATRQLLPKLEILHIVATSDPQDVFDAVRARNLGLQRLRLGSIFEASCWSYLLRLVTGEEEA